jgi:hypothetical protein
MHDVDAAFCGYMPAPVAKVAAWHPGDALQTARGVL